jgi:hypothetical protein
MLGYILKARSEGEWLLFVAIIITVLVRGLSGNWVDGILSG